MKCADREPPSRTCYTVTSEPRLKIDRPYPPHTGSLAAGWLSLLALAFLSACATHRHAPPECKGPYTPINQTPAVTSHVEKP